MIVFPAIDLKDGQCVRLRQGDMTESTVFADDPAAQAVKFQRAGFQWLHVVDLNGAVSGASVNAKPVTEILTAVNIPVQLGGGIRDLNAIDRWLSAGVARIILGTAAVRNPTLVLESARLFPGRIAVGIDSRDGRVAIEGWVADSSIPALDLARRHQDAGIAAIIFTDISRDGMLQGVNVEATAAIARAVSVPVIASGGVSSLDDIRRLKACSAPISGVVVGRALYDGRIEPASALSAAA